MESNALEYINREIECTIMDIQRHRDAIYQDLLSRDLAIDKLKMLRVQRAAVSKAFGVDVSYDDDQIDADKIGYDHVSRNVCERGKEMLCLLS